MSSQATELLKGIDTEIFPVKIGSRELQFHKPTNIEGFVDPDDPMTDFPLWAKIWEASVVLMQYMADLPVEPDCRVLELGSGLGVAGISAAVMGHDVTLTEYNDHALTFLRANAQINLCEHLPIHRLDWFAPEMEGTFDLIIGSEIVYQESALKVLRDLFKQYLAPQGKVVLAERVRATGARFFEEMAPHYNVRVQQRTLRSGDKKETIALFELSQKSSP